VELADEPALRTCPINPEAYILNNTCTVRQCQYNIKGNCFHKEMTNQSPEEFLISKGLLDKARHISKRIKAYVYIDRFLLYAVNTSLVQIKKEDMHRLLDSTRFYAWPESKPETYWVLEAVYEELFVPKKIKRKGMVDHPVIGKVFRIQVESKFSFYA
jgi:hypothetical protein